MWPGKIPAPLGLAVLVFLITACSPRFSGRLYDPPLPKEDRVFQGAQGPVKLSDFKGRPLAVFFGFTRCPDVCPTALAYLRQAKELSGSWGDKLQVLFISVDWHDTPQQTQAFAQDFHKDFLGVTGDKQVIDAAAKDFGVYYRIDSKSPQSWTVEHTATIFVLDSKGQLRVTWSPVLSPQEIARDLPLLGSF